MSLIQSIPIKIGDYVTTTDGKNHVIFNMVQDEYRIFIHLENGEIFEARSSVWHEIFVDDAAQYFLRIGNYFFPQRTNSSICCLEEVCNRLSDRIQEIESTINSHLDSDNDSITMEFLRGLYARLKGIREAKEVVESKIEELRK